MPPAQHETSCQGREKRHVLRDEELTLIVAKYILANPVRAGLCNEPQEFRFSGSLVWSKEQMNDLWSGRGIA